MEDDLIIVAMEDNFNIVAIGRQPQYFPNGRPEDDPTILENGRRPQYLGKGKATSISF